MMNVMKKKTVKGFTLIEMIVVIGIIIVLLGVLAPSMMAYYQSSRVKATNANAKMIYNAAQTEIMKYVNKDRAATAGNESGFSGTVWFSYQPGAGNRYSKSGASPAPSSLTETSGASSDVTATNCNNVISKVNTLVSGANEVCWTVYVENYIVKGCVSAPSANSTYIGFYSANKQQADEPSNVSYSNAGSGGGLSTLSDVVRRYNPSQD